MALAMLAAPVVCRAQQGAITTVAGGGTQVPGDFGPAINAALSGPNGVAADSAGNIYIVQSDRISKVSTAGIITTLAGGGPIGTLGDFGLATAVEINNPSSVAVDSAGNVYIGDPFHQRVRKVNTAGVITTVAGMGNQGYSGDGGLAIGAALNDPASLAVDSAGNLYIADSGNFRVRKVDTRGIITTVAGNGSLNEFGDLGLAIGAGINYPAAVTVDGAGNLYIISKLGDRVRKVNKAGIITTVAGIGTNGFSGDGGLAINARLNVATGLAADSAGNIYIADSSNFRIRRVDTGGIITTVAGNGISGFSGDFGPATSAEMVDPLGVAADSAGNFYISDSNTHRVRKVTVGVYVSAAVNGASFQAGIVPNSWATIQGSSLASSTGTWADSIVNGRLPTTLDGVTVTIGGKPAYLSYISPGQINLLVPDIGTGPVLVTVTRAAGTSEALTVTSSQYGPAFFSWPASQVVATRQDFTLAAKAGTFTGAATVPAKPGDILILWGTGFGPTTPAAPAGVQVPDDQTYATSTLPSVTINNLPATVYGAALAPGFAGLYQVAIQVPATLADGDWPVVASIGGVQSPSGMVLSVKQ